MVMSGMLMRLIEHCASQAVHIVIMQIEVK